MDTALLNDLAQPTHSRAIKGRAGAAFVVEPLADPMEPGLARLLGAWHRMNWVSLWENSSPLSTDRRVQTA
jgi:hypothetical protein